MSVKEKKHLSFTIKPVENSDSKIDKTKILITIGTNFVAYLRSKALQNAPLGAFCNTLTFIKRQLSRGMGFPTMWYVRPPKPQISLRIRAV